MISAWGVDHGVAKALRSRDWAIPIAVGATSSVIANQFPQNQSSWQSFKRRRKKEKEEKKVAKSYIGAGRWVSATKMPKSDLKTAVRAGKMWRAEEAATSRAFYNSARNSGMPFHEFRVATHPYKAMRRAAATDFGGKQWSSQASRIAHSSSEVRGRNEWHALATGDQLHAAEYSPSGIRAYREVENRLSHRIHKSYIPGTGYVKASKTTKRVLRAANQHRAGYLQAAKNSSKEFGENLRRSDQDVKDYITAAHREGRVYSTKGHQTHVAPDTWENLTTFGYGSPLRGRTAVAGSKKHGVTVSTYPHHADADTINHEATHGAPRRSSYRMRTIIDNPTKLAREEARAEMGTGAKHTYYKKLGPGVRRESAYAGAARRESSRTAMESNADKRYQKMYEPKNVAAYRQVQDKIAAARTAKGRKPWQTTTWTTPTTMSTPRKVVTEAVEQHPDATLLGAGGTGLLGAAAVSRHNTKKRQRVAKSDEPLFLDMGGAMLAQPYKTEQISQLRTRDRATGRFVAAPTLVMKARSV